MKTRVVRHQRDLDDLCRRLADQPRIGLDTEFHRETTFFPRLCLIQVSTADELALVDPLADVDLAPFHDVLLDEKVTKILHAGEQDLEIFYRATGQVPRSVFDTQIVAALLGHGDQIGYARLVSVVCNQTVRKGETLSDWARRPLSDEQMDYALDDVRYLFEIHDAMTADLDARGRAEWAEQELDRLQSADRFEFDSETAVRRIRSAWSLDRRGLAVLGQLVAWREDEAQGADEPRGRIARDDGLIGLARRQPRKPRDLKGYRGLHRNVVDRCGEAILEAVRRGLETPDDELPEPIDRPETDAAGAARTDLLWAFVRSLALEAAIGPATLAGRDLLASLVASPPATLDDLTGRPELAGWRGEVLARPLFEIVSGRRAVAFATPDEPGRALVLVDRPAPGDMP